MPNADHYPTRIRKRVKNKHDFKDIKVPNKKFHLVLPTADHYPTRIRKKVKNKHDFKDIKVPVKIRDIHKTEKKNCISVTVFDY